MIILYNITIMDFFVGRCVVIWTHVKWYRPTMKSIIVYYILNLTDNCSCRKIVIWNERQWRMRSKCFRMFIDIVNIHTLMFKESFIDLLWQARRYRVESNCDWIQSKICFNIGATIHQLLSVQIHVPKSNEHTMLWLLHL